MHTISKAHACPICKEPESVQAILVEKKTHIKLKIDRCDHCDHQNGLEEFTELTEGN